MESSNPNAGVDFFLKALGFEDRADWTLLSRDDRTYRGEVIASKPDFVVERAHAPGGVLVVEYKSRRIGTGNPRDYETWEAVIHAMTVKEVLEAERGVSDLVVGAALVYGDGEKFVVDYGEDEERSVEFTALEASHMEQRVSATELAKILSGADFSHVSASQRAAGTQAHWLLAQAGPETRH